ncbi:acetoacetyl-CoA reductase [Oryzomicrobium terrae]|uniref:Acetoacetyl-CoA reductase n=1 Tax=Oryzomicrobium terrae TaxID=1735038 RepID=A0A5C1E9D2_9RHOO|nr:beta-ketoacyl-ACP reductase [Oryzomicrobium terrae]QEL65490.1 acetoacetyl-CoA reductase [Oryzomicrobium terrae]
MTQSAQRIALVTGAMGGIGSAVCQELAKAGYKVAANYHPQFDNPDEWLKEQAEAGFKDFVPVAGDVSDYESCKAMVAEVEAKLGPVDILVNNAGITRDKFFAKMEKGQWDAVINTNLNSLFNVTHQVSAKMAERGWGRIINISSVNGVKGQAGQSNYSAAKAGVIGFTKALAQELAAKGVTVNAIAPGYIATKMVMAIKPEILQTIVDSVPMKRLGKPEEIGGLCAYLASDMAGFVTGATININGGLYYQ